MIESMCVDCCHYFETSEQIEDYLCLQCSKKNEKKKVIELNEIEIVLTNSVLKMKNGLDFDNRRYPIVELYFIHGVKTNLTKIGYSVNSIERIKTLQLFSPDILELWGFVYCRIELENDVHKIMEKHRLHGEWFETPTWLKEWVDKYGDSRKMACLCNFEW